MAGFNLIAPAGCVYVSAPPVGYNGKVVVLETGQKELVSGVVIDPSDSGITKGEAAYFHWRSGRVVGEDPDKEPNQVFKVRTENIEWLGGLAL